MRRVLWIILILSFSTSLFASDFVTLFLEKYAEEDRPLSNVNIGRTMLEKMAANTDDEGLKNAFRDLKSIRIISTEEKNDALYYFKKANELIKESFGDFEEMVSVNEKDAKISVFMKAKDENNQELILISLDEDSKLTIITISGKINFKSISKLPEILKNETTPKEGDKTEEPASKKPKTDNRLLKTGKPIYSELAANY